MTSTVLFLQAVWNFSTWRKLMVQFEGRKGIEKRIFARLERVTAWLSINSVDVSPRVGAVPRHRGARVPQELPARRPQRRPRRQRRSHARAHGAGAPRHVWLHVAWVHAVYCYVCGRQVLWIVIRCHFSSVRSDQAPIHPPGSDLMQSGWPDQDDFCFSLQSEMWNFRLF